MDILKAFVLDGTEHKINILWENDEPLFRAKEIGDVLGIVKVRTSIVSFNDREKVDRTVATLGGLQGALFLTERGVYKLLSNSRKPAARPFQEWVYDVIKSIRQTGKYELEKLVEKGIQKALEDEAAKYKREVELARHQSLIEAFRNRSVVYFGKIKEMPDAKCLVKIGSTDDIFNRLFSLNRDYGSVVLFHVIEVAMNRKFEEYLQIHRNISCYVYKGEIHQGKRSIREVFLMTNTEIEKMLSIAKKNTYKFTTDVYTDKMIELKRMELQNTEARIREIELKRETSKNEENEDEAEKSDDVTTVTVDIGYHERNYTQGRGSKIQRYSPDGKHLIQTYPGTAEATRDETLDAPSGKGIRDAIKRRSIYKGYRWAALSRDLIDDIHQDIGDTMKIQEVRKGFVAMLSLDKKQIVNVFCDQKAAAEDRQFSGGAAISSAIKNGTKSGGHYFQMWHDVIPELQMSYLGNNTLPKKRIAVNAQLIEQIEPISGKIIARFASAADITKTIRISRNSLKTALDHRYILKGYIWRYAD
ncbi:BRO N-terminal domain containing protein [Dishui Lake large algae virus 1]|nr:BRO N-terminal domain containing protein [Dishui Lake large algae virus 1]